MTAPARPALRYHGSKWRLAPWLFRYFPPHRHYTEAFGGSAAVLLQKPRVNGAEIYNDLDRLIVGFFQVLRDPVQRAELEHRLRHTPFARAEFDAAWEETADPIESARRIAIRSQMGFGSAGASKGVTGFRTDADRNPAADWAAFPDTLAAVAGRLRGVLLECLPALEVLRRYDDPETLHYVDPPYLHGTRVMRAKGGYRHEMTDADHATLLDELKALRGMVVVSGYPNTLYSDALAGWMTAQTRSRISAGRGTRVRTEQIWLNQAAATALERDLGGLFQGESSHG